MPGKQGHHLSEGRASDEDDQGRVARMTAAGQPGDVKRRSLGIQEPRPLVGQVGVIERVLQ